MPILVCFHWIRIQVCTVQVRRDAGKLEKMSGFCIGWQQQELWHSHFLPCMTDVGHYGKLGLNMFEYHSQGVRVRPGPKSHL